MKRYALTVLVASALLVAAGGAIVKEGVKLETIDGVQVAGFFVKGSEDKGPGVVLLHMLTKSKEDWEEILQKHELPQGFSYLAIDLRGHGDSVTRGEEPVEWDTMSQEDFADMVKDVRAAVAYLKARAEVDPEQIAVVGASIGANVALNYAAMDPTVKAVALLSPGLDYRGVKTAEAMKKYGARPVYIAAAREDAQALEAVGALKKSAAGEAVVDIFDGNLHGTRMFAGYPVGKKLSAFLGEHLAKRPQVNE